MGLAQVRSRALHGLDAREVVVEAHVCAGGPSFSVVGLPEAEVRESRDRVRSALLNAGFEFPVARVTVNLAPADLPKEGGRFDLPIALGILAATRQIDAPELLAAHEFSGELALGGDLRGIRGALPLVIAARDQGRRAVLPSANADEAAWFAPSEVGLAETLPAVVAYLRGQSALLDPPATAPALGAAAPDLLDVYGLALPKRALEIAAAGGHNLLLCGPPGSGKTLLAQCLPALLPALDDRAALEVAQIASVAGLSPPMPGAPPPLRCPHHSASPAALAGGGSPPQPGEISLAHHGILFLDEFPEFPRRALEMLREPLEAGRIVIARAGHCVPYPARFMLVAAMNPCPCGYAGDPSGRCRCTPDQIQRYAGRISGPLLDRIDLHVDVPRQRASELKPSGREEASATVAARVAAARRRAQSRQGGLNAELRGPALAIQTQLASPDLQMLESAIDRLGLSARALSRIRRVARTVADLRDGERIERADLLEALAYRAR